MYAAASGARITRFVSVIVPPSVALGLPSRYGGTSTIQAEEGGVYSGGSGGFLSPDFFDDLAYCIC
jgi:hypothetical protein